MTELTFENYLKSNSSEDRIAIVERAFQMIDKQKEYIALLGQEIDDLIPFAVRNGWKSNLVEQGEAVRKEMAEIYTQ